jgi:hypothetical protein
MAVAERVTMTGLIFLDETLSMGTPLVSCGGSSWLPVSTAMVVAERREVSDVDGVEGVAEMCGLKG